MDERRRREARTVFGICTIAPTIYALSVLLVKILDCDPVAFYGPKMCTTVMGGGADIVVAVMHLAGIASVPSVIVAGIVILWMLGSWAKHG